MSEENFPSNNHSDSRRWRIRIADIFCEYEYSLVAQVDDACIHDLYKIVRDRLKADDVFGRLLGSEPGDLFGVWVATADNPHPDKPGKKSYEIVPCLVVHKGEIEICAWNCEHGVWDDADGDDFRYTTAQVSHWMPLPPPPNIGAQP